MSVSISPSGDLVGKEKTYTISKISSEDSGECKCSNEVGHQYSNSVTLNVLSVLSALFWLRSKRQKKKADKVTVRTLGRVLKTTHTQLSTPQAGQLMCITHLQFLTPVLLLTHPPPMTMRILQ
ncbi:hypothetical protein QTP86_016902 [Hemibagrus guttatus]|nr:hypothetical protein QTP86_016902 [Hemibagrus guttatus]